MTTAELRKTRVGDDEVVGWRREQLMRAGCDPAAALILAKRSGVDLHQAVDLLERGCPARVALEILLSSCRRLRRERPRGEALSCVSGFAGTAEM